MTESEVGHEELEEMAKAANKYAAEIKEPEEQKEREEKIEEFEEIISSERELLKLFSPDRFNINIVYNRKLLKFKIKPVRSTKKIMNLGMDLRVYMSLTDLERGILDKKGRGESLTLSEQELYDKNNEKFDELLENDLDPANEILALFLSPPSYSKVRDLKKRHQKKLDFWMRFPLDIKSFLVGEVVTCLGLNPETELKLFQAG